MKPCSCYDPQAFSIPSQMATDASMTQAPSLGAQDEISSQLPSLTQQLFDTIGDDIPSGQPHPVSQTSPIDWLSQEHNAAHGGPAGRLQPPPPPPPTQSPTSGGSQFTQPPSFASPIAEASTGQQCSQHFATSHPYLHGSPDARPASRAPSLSPTQPWPPDSRFSHQQCAAERPQQQSTNLSHFPLTAISALLRLWCSYSCPSPCSCSCVSGLSP